MAINEKKDGKKLSLLSCLLIILIIIIIPVLIHLLATAYFTHLIAKEKLLAGKRGEVTELSQLVKTKISENENRAPLYIKASKNLTVDVVSDYGIEYYDKNKAGLEEVFKNYDYSFEHMKEAMKKDKCNFNLDIENGLYYMENRIDTFSLVTLSRLLSLKALEDIKEGKYEEAVDKCNQCITLGLDVGNEPLGLMGAISTLTIIKAGIYPLTYMNEHNIKADYTTVADKLERAEKSLDDIFIKMLEVERTLQTDNFYIAYGYKSIDPNLPYCLPLAHRFPFNILCTVAKPYILANTLAYFKGMNRIIDETEKGTLNNNVFMDLKRTNKYYAITDLTFKTGVYDSEYWQGKDELIKQLVELLKKSGK